MFDAMKKKSLLDLKKLTKQSVNMTKLRNNTKILVIDDQGFDYLDNMRSFGFTNLKDVEDINSLDEVTGFGIVLVDIEGVGKKIYGENVHDGGKYLMKDIKETYPHKSLIGYSGKRNFDITISDYTKHCDHIIEKDSTVQDVSDIFDIFALIQIDPIEVWNRQISPRLEHLSVRDKSRFESEYVKSILNKTSSINYSKYNLSADDKEFITKLVKGGISLGSFLVENIYG